jgi:hypothetical protein
VVRKSRIRGLMAGLQSSHSHTQTILEQVKAEQNQRFRAYGLISFPSARLVFEQSFPPGTWESLRFTKRYEAYHLDVSRIPPECPDSAPSDRSVAADVLLRQEPYEEEEETKTTAKRRTKTTAKKRTRTTKTTTATRSERALIYFRG